MTLNKHINSEFRRMWKYNGVDYFNVGMLPLLFAELLRKIKKSLWKGLWSEIWNRDYHPLHRDVRFNNMKLCSLRG